MPISFPWRAITLCVVLSLAPLHATTVEPPAFPELVAESEVVARAQVKEIQARWVDSSQGRVIRTFVTFVVEKALKGTCASELTLSFLGGELDGQGMRVEGMPAFAVGGTDILFISDRANVRFCPLVAMMHGRYYVRKDLASGRSYIARNDGSPLENEADVQLPHSSSAVTNRLKSVSRALSLEAFEEKIVAEANRVAQKR